MRRTAITHLRSPLANRSLGASQPSRSNRPMVRHNQRARGERNQKLPFVPPEDWYEPKERKPGQYRIVSQSPGEGYRHILTPQQIRDRLARLPAEFVEPLEVIQLSQMTRKKRCYPCYGMQWGSTLYLYPIEENLVEHFDAQPKPDVINEARMYGGQWREGRGTAWELVWTPEAIQDFYLNNILLHELGHLLDTRNTTYMARERYAEWFAVHYGYRASRSWQPRPPRRNVHRHGKK
jgi:hypothetical protein